MDIKNFLKKYSPGMRTIKTGLSVLICLCVGYLVQARFPVYACIAAIVTMQDTLEKSINSGKMRLIGTGIGGVVGIAFLWVDSLWSNVFYQIIMITLSVISGLVVCNRLKQKDACSICAVVILVIMIGHTKQDIYLHALNRIIETAFGVIVAVVINRYFYPYVIDDMEHQH